MKIHRTITLCFIISLMLSSGVYADVVFESESNDSFGTRNIFGSSATEIRGTTTENYTPDLFGSGTLTPGGVVDFVFGGLISGDSFVITTDNTVGASFPDITLGSFDEFGSLLNSDDDSSPFGNGLASALDGFVNADGTIRASVSGFEDFDFDGTDDATGVGHLESGDFDLFVQLGTALDLLANVDFFSITGLVPGTAFSLEVTDGNFDTVLGLFDNTGSLIGTDDDSGAGLFSRIDATVDGTGTLNFAISGFDDFDFDGISDNGGTVSAGDYVISINSTAAVPEPSGLILASLVIFSLCFWHFQNRETGTTLTK